MVFEKLFMKILNKERKPKQISILIIGLNNSGKSTIVNFFKNKDVRKSVSIPTIGFNIEHFENQGVSFTAYDMAGIGRYRNLWEHHFKTCNGIVFVIDSSDRMRLVVVKDELDLLLQHPDLKRRRVPILFFANKMDCIDALSSVKIAAGLNLEKVDNKPWQICSSNALSGEGLQNGVHWLTSQIKECVLTPPDKEVYD
ncbi:CLUMA_CG005032, isoform A [Clunio marinus]|uniref:ADP-ribosylation factor-like protein 6 n=1 Tax=Clunio marinus TaxID=568069 RepID=A0A1J1HTH4_9DIPT|nr:CLUMA_CG005032, isoform A [Clunio marinus]